MQGGNLAVDVLLALGIAGEVVCVLGVVVMRTSFDRLHYAAAGSTVPAALVLAAVLVREHLSSGGLEAIAAVALLLLLNPLVTLMTARAIHDVESRS